MKRVEDVARSEWEAEPMAHGWTLAAVAPVDGAGAHAAIAKPAAAVPDSVAARLGRVRIVVVPYIACGGERDFVSDRPPEGETHSSLWLYERGALQLLLSFLDASEHDVGFELLAVVADLVVPKMSAEEFGSYAALLDKETREAVTGEIDPETLEAKESDAAEYPAVSLAATLAEYMHALWHDVETRDGPMHLPARCLRRRFELLRRIFPPNPGYVLWARPR